MHITTFFRRFLQQVQETYQEHERARRERFANLVKETMKIHAHEFDDYDLLSLVRKFTLEDLTLKTDCRNDANLAYLRDRHSVSIVYLDAIICGIFLAVLLLMDKIPISQLSLAGTTWFGTYWVGMFILICISVAGIIAFLCQVTSRLVERIDARTVAKILLAAKRYKILTA